MAKFPFKIKYTLSRAHRIERILSGKRVDSEVLDGELSKEEMRVLLETDFIAENEIQYDTADELIPVEIDICNLHGRQTSETNAKKEIAVKVEYDTVPKFSDMVKVLLDYAKANQVLRSKNAEIKKAAEGVS